MARFQFPAKPGKIFAKKSVISSCNFPVKREKRQLIQNTSAFLQDFYNTFGESDEEQDELFHGFTNRDQEKARSKYNQLSLEGDSIREELWLARGVKLDRQNREAIREKTGRAIRDGRSVSTESSQSKISEIPQPRQKIPKVPSRLSLPKATKHDARDASGRFCAKSSPSTRKKRERDRQLRQSRTVSDATPKQEPKAHIQIQIPSWRKVDFRFEDWKRLAGPMEDLTDEVYEERHRKAEEEEQVLWEKWQTLRTATGQKVRGRSKSRRWREVNMPAAVRTARISSLQSEDSFSGRLSPRTENLQEIHIATAPPTPQTAPPTPQPEEPTQDTVLHPLPELCLKDTKDFCSISMPLSPPLSPVNESPKNRRKSSEPRRTRSNSAKDVLSNVKDPRSREQRLVIKSPLKPVCDGDQPGEPETGLVNDGQPPVKRRNTVKPTRSSGSLAGRGKRLTSPRSMSSTFSRTLYPLRSQSPSRRTRQGSRR